MAPRPTAPTEAQWHPAAWGGAVPPAAVEACVPVCVGWTDLVWACAQFRGVVCPHDEDVQAAAAMDGAAVLVTSGQIRPCCGPGAMGLMRAPSMPGRSKVLLGFRAPCWMRATWRHAGFPCRAGTSILGVGRAAPEAGPLARRMAVAALSGIWRAGIDQGG